MVDEESALARITSEMSIADVVSRFPQTIPVFSRHGVVCAGCSAADQDTVAQAARAHGVDGVVLLDELNACLRRPFR